MDHRELATLRDVALNRFFDNTEFVLKKAQFSKSIDIAERAQGSLESIEHIRSILEPIWLELKTNNNV